MPEHAKSEFSRMPWYRKLAMVVLLPFVLPAILLGFAVVLAMGLCAGIANYVAVLRFRARMRQCGRFLRWREFSGRIAAEGSGTLIIESPSLGWGFTHAWWTPRKILADCPYALPSNEEYRTAAQEMRCPDWDRWHWDNFTDPDKGRGFLLRVWNGRSVETWVRRDFPAVDVVHTWTGLVHAQKLATEPGSA